VTAQGLIRGNEYTVVDIDVQSTGFGDFVKYKLYEKGGHSRWIVNGHMILKRAKQMFRVTFRRRNKRKVLKGDSYTVKADDEADAREQVRTLLKMRFKNWYNLPSVHSVKVVDA
jgi:hypothetical protein